MSNLNSDSLFSWKVAESRKERNPDKESAEYWQKRASKAADDAIRQACDYPSKSRHDSPDDGVYAEAQQLVRGWLTEQRAYGGRETRDSFMRLSCEDDDGERRPSVLEVRKEWEHLVVKLETRQGLKEEVDAILESQSAHPLSQDPRLMTVMNDLRKKSFVKKSQLRLVDSPRHVDVVRKMEDRQQEVRRKREERVRNEEMQRMKKIAEKEARSEAMKMLKEEKREREAAIKKEEELIQLEMRRIKAEMEAQRDTQRETHRETHTDRQRKTQKKPQKEEEEGPTESSSKADSQQQRRDVITEIVERRFTNKSLVRLRRCFQLWRDAGEARAVRMRTAADWSDWQRCRRAFRGWRRCARLAAVSRDIEREQTRVREQQRKEATAIHLWQNTVLRKCLLHWGLFVVHEKESRWFEKLEEMRKRKMETYIEQLQEKAKENQRKLESLSLENSAGSNKMPQMSDAALHSMEIISERTSKKSEKDIPHNKSRCSSARLPNKTRNVPQEAWQVTKKHVNLPIELLVDNATKTPLEGPVLKAIRPPKVVDKFAHRNATQMELIEQQRSKLKEQERLINDLVSGNIQSRNRDQRSDLDVEEVKDYGSAMSETNAEDVPISKEVASKKINKFVAQMEERAKERERIRTERLEKQRRLDEDKRRQLAEEVALQCKIDAEEKLRKEQMLKERRDKERMKAELKKKKMEEEQQKNDRADQFYRSLLLRRYGLGRWGQAMSMKRRRLEVASDHHRTHLLRKVFSVWHQDTLETSKCQDEVVFSFYNKILLRRCFQHFRLYKLRFEIMEGSALGHYEATLVRRTFGWWRLCNHRAQVRLDRLEVVSGDLYARRLMRRVLEAWRGLPVAAREERLREGRRAAMRERVVALLPDFGGGGL